MLKTCTLDQNSLIIIIVDDDDDIHLKIKSCWLVVLTSDQALLNYIVKLVMDGSCLPRHTTVLPASSCYRLFIYGLNFSFSRAPSGAFLTLIDQICLANNTPDISDGRLGLIIM